MKGPGNRLYAAGKSPGPVTEAACWSHSRRKFFELADIAAGKRRGKNAPPISPVALEAVKRIDLLFDIERGINGKPTEQRLALRQQLSAPVLADLKCQSAFNIDPQSACKIDPPERHGGGCPGSQ